MSQDKNDIPAAPASGSFEASDKFGHFGDLLAYESITSCVQQIVSVICGAITDKADSTSKASPQKVLIVDSLEQSLEDGYRLQVMTGLKAHTSAISACLTELKRGIGLFSSTNTTNLESKAILPALNEVGTTLGAVASVLNFIKEDYILRGRDLSIFSETAKLALAGALAGQKQDSIEVGIANYALLEQTPLLRDVNAAIELRDQTQSQLQTLKQLIQDFSGDQSKINVIAVSKPIVESVNGTLSSFDSFVKSISTSNDSTPAILTLALSRDHIREKKYDYLLFVKTTTAGSEYATKKGLLPMDSISFFGSAVLIYSLAKTTGTVIAGGTVAKETHRRWEPFPDGWLLDNWQWVPIVGIVFILIAIIFITSLLR
jgi:hypothetical protein